MTDKKYILSILVIFFMLQTGFSAEVNVKNLTNLFGKPCQIVPSVNAPKIDGKLDDAAWQKAPKLVFSLNRGKGKPNQLTWAKVVSDKENLYICTYCVEPEMGKLVADVKKTDGALWSDDYIELFIDPGHTEGYNFYHFIINSKGVAFHAKSGNKRWNPSTFRAVPVREKEAWGLEMKISFSDLVENTSKLPKLWGLNLMRYRQPKMGRVDFGSITKEQLKKYLASMESEETAWSPTRLLTSKAPSRFGQLYFQAGTVEDALIRKFLAGESLKPKGRFPIRKQDINRLIGAPTVLVPKVKQGPVIDGDLNDKAWSESEELHFAINMGGATPKHKTFAKLVTDNENIYICYKCFDSEAEFLIADEVGKGNARWGEDTVELFIDPYARKNAIKYFNMIFNPVGAYKLARSGFDYNWDPTSFEMKTKREKDFWTLEMKFAFKDLLDDPKTIPCVWSLNLLRARQPKFDKVYEDTCWALTNQNYSHIPEMFGHAFLEVGNSMPKVVKEYIKKRDSLSGK